MRRRKTAILSVAVMAALGAAHTAVPAIAQANSSAVADPQRWPAKGLAAALDPAIEQQIDALIARMSLEQKVGQIIQADIASATPEDVRRYHLGSILNGGNSTPTGEYNAPASKWLEAADAYYAASMKPQGDLPRIPVIWGSDAVHGHNNIVGATLFPHNIGLGAANDPDLMRRIGEVTAIEMRVTGLDWTFAPTLAVVRDDRWGRTYEGFGETPDIATSYAAPLIEGLQGKLGDDDWLRGSHIVATAKHFLGDGGTAGGKDQGDARIDEGRLRRQRVAGRSQGARGERHGDYIFRNARGLRPRRPGPGLSKALRRVAEAPRRRRRADRGRRGGRPRRRLLEPGKASPKQVRLPRGG